MLGNAAWPNWEPVPDTCYHLAHFSGWGRFLETALFAGLSLRRGAPSDFAHSETHLLTKPGEADEGKEL